MNPFWTLEIATVALLVFVVVPTVARPETYPTWLGVVLIAGLGISVRVLDAERRR